MSYHDLQSRCIAFAGMCQAAYLVDKLSTTGSTGNQSAFEASLHSIMRTESDSPLDIFGGYSSLNVGFNSMLEQLGNKDKKRNMQITKYLIGMIILEKKLSKNPIYTRAHPQWLLDLLFNGWGSAIALEIIAANNQRAPMVLRVNQQQISRDGYLEQLKAADIPAQATKHSAQGIVLDAPMDVTALPDFDKGFASVQDEAAQLAASLLNLKSGQSVLDACCAPGGKTCHILETQSDLSRVVAVELESRRIQRVEENLARLGLQAELKVADACELESWWDNEGFDRILLDAPCSATGVIRRHPDIKLLRKPTDIVKLAEIQLQLLRSLWQTLNDGGILLYATCSVLGEENDQVIEKFLAETPEASVHEIDGSWGIKTDCGRQLFPTINGNDGFYYSRLGKKA